MWMLVCLFPFMSRGTKTRVELTSPVQPVTIGDILAIQCQVWNMQDEYTVNLFRVMNELTEQLTLRGNYDSHSSLGQRAFLAKRTFSGSSLVMFLTVVEISASDEGEYLCKVHSVIRGTFNDIAQDSITVEIFAFPSSIYPSCNSIPNTLIINTGKELVLKCTSEKGYPVVRLDWSCMNVDVQFVTHDSTIIIDDNSDTLMSRITLSVDASHNGAIFECKLESDGFPDRVRSCHIGPLQIVQNTGIRNIEVPIHQNTDNIDSIKKQNQFPSDFCDTPCEPEDQFTLLYWAVATVGTTTLMFIFLTTTIIYCCKYQKMSAEVITAQGFSSCDGTEPVYVSLQRRQPTERNSMFMSVEDPNNPGNKVLMPREVFDEFYRSLCLKKGELPRGRIYE